MIAALFVRQNSFYKTLPSVDCYDIERDARTWPGTSPGVFHPPCRAWGQLSHMANPRSDEKELAIWSMQMVRACGGVLEHPISSRLWQSARCASPGIRDIFGGILIPIYQSWFGHRAPKKTGLYIVGPVLPFDDTLPPVMKQSIESMSQAAREHTPPLLALHLVKQAQACLS